MLMKKLSKAFGYFALIVLLSAVLLGYLHMLDARRMKIFVIVGIILSVVGHIIYLIYNRLETAKNYGKKTGLNRLSYNIMMSSAVGAVIALMFIMLHMRSVGRPLLNFSLGSFIVGVVIAMIWQYSNSARLHGSIKQQAIVFNSVRLAIAINSIIYLSTICMTIGLLLKVNHHPEGKLLINGGIAFLIAFLFIIVIYARYVKKKSAT
jgi:hypothetical protein